MDVRLSMRLKGQEHVLDYFILKWQIQRVVFSHVLLCLFSVLVPILNFNTSERCFLTTLAGYPLSLSSDWKFLMFSSNVALKEFFLRSLNNSP